ncbi:Mrp/NBP35 family ATP-binding protein [Staphylococcus saccharolyticus]|uniref:Mrp/NBP35 family ATP-binding protein n=1 Tax=Staphylococcus saccharolyticus TaxID=33028 RepID=UPI00102DC2A0|nr:Mrp/NBP35 family ATP-binding protein [Staphylococcus saccharolyticus]MBL7573508.1 Mrp/NBP35 family ATP-binding protein [Staphylococcus saccharolyticus]MBL7584701.1 Mrp/NBP35 family ATP-binding protein [Staphylococcus saccharolyticus]MBL7639562.1 Mrp/NBP35 family ATP-binding protein [Staphylococcus saccharolyticus]QRJ68873.1 Mrp/NBP35 family ATP-binding protein [Staphylococcus saccharolyticus]TAA92198.1 chromosome partitioning protein ParA [Staphylococcus saccharolyticus]
MLTVNQVKEIIGALKDPIINVPLKETDGIVNVSIKENIEHLSIKVAMAQLGGQPQLDLQMSIVKVLKENGANTVGIRFEELPVETVEKYRGKGTEKSKTIEQLLSQNNSVEFISIASGKGGVGKSTVAVNLAVALAREGKEVGLVDADIYGFSVPDMMGIEERPGIDGKEIIPVERHGVKVISMAFFVEENAPVIWRGLMLGKMLTNFFTEVQWGDLDYLLLDLPPGTGDVALDVHSMLPSSKEIIVTTPHPTAAFVAARAGAMAKHTEHSILGVIENMSYFESKETGNKEYVFGKGGGTKLANELDTQLLGELPLEQPTWISNDFSPSIYQLDDRLGKIYKSIARKVIATTQK